jgi:hypothetical protein
VLPAGTPGANLQVNIDDLARGVLAFVGLVAVYVDACGQVDEWWEEQAVDSCKFQCNRWFPKPPLPDPQPNPEGEMSGHLGLEILNQIVPEPDGSGGGWGDIAPPGTVDVEGDMTGIVPEPPLL